MKLLPAMHVFIIPLYEHTIIYGMFYRWTFEVSSLGLLQIRLLSTFLYMFRFSQMYVFISPESYLGVELLDLSRCVFNSIENCPVIHQSGYLILYLYQQQLGVPGCFISSPAFGIVFYFSQSHLFQCVSLISELYIYCLYCCLKCKGQCTTVITGLHLNLYCIGAEEMLYTDFKN